MQPFSFAASLSRREALHSGALLGAGALASTLPLAPPAAAQAAPAISAADRWPQTAAFVERHLRRGAITGMVAAMGYGTATPDVIARGDRLFDGRHQVTADTLYRIYSMTKPVTGMAAMICVDEGLIALDQPLHDVLPAFRTMQVQRRYDGAITADNLEAAARPITMRHLLTHTAGLGYTIVQQGAIRDAYLRNGLNPARVSNLPIARQFLGGNNIAPSLEVFADRLAQLPLVRQPGTRWSYSVGLDLMGRVIEVVTGQSFASFLQSRIFDPAGMVDTHFRVPRDKADRLAGNYFLFGGAPIPLDLPNSSVFLDTPEFPFGGAGLVSSARDYDRFLRMIANLGTIGSTRLMSEAAVRMGTSDLLPDTLEPGGGFDAQGVPFGYGAGGLVGRGEAEGLFGWFGAAGTVGMVHMPSRLRMTMMTQFMPADGTGMQAEFPRTVMTDAATQAVS